MSETQKIVPLRGKKPAPGFDADHPLPWVYGNGYIWDARGRVVGQAVAEDTAAWIIRCVNAVPTRPG